MSLCGDRLLGWWYVISTVTGWSVLIANLWVLICSVLQIGGERIIVYHGYTLTTKLAFSDVVRTIQVPQGFFAYLTAHYVIFHMTSCDISHDCLLIFESPHLCNLILP